MIAGNVPSHLVVAARTGFLATAEPEVPAYDPIAETLDMSAASVELVDLGGSPMPTRNKGRAQGQDFIEKKLTVTPLDWDITVWISHNAIKDDQTKTLERKVRGAGMNFQKHIAQQAFKALNDGDAITNFGAGYDSLSFYNDSHVDKGAAYSTAQDNKYGLTLNLDNFETVRVAATKTRDDQGEFSGFDYDLLVVSPELERVAANICNNKDAYDTANREMNPYAGKLRYIVSPKLDSTAWILTASNAGIKPIIVAMRESPNLQAAWFDPNAKDGGRYYFKFYARYNHFYGDWRTAYMGNS